MNALIRRTARLRETGPQGLGRGSRIQRRFSPLAIPGLLAWYDADYPATLFQDAAMTTPATAENDPVGAWLDLSGNGRHATQATAGNRPLLDLAAIGGRSALNVVHASSTFLHVNSLAATFTGEDKAFSVVAVVKKTTNTTADLLLTGSNSGVATPFFDVRTDTTGKWAFVIRDDAGGTKSTPAAGTATSDAQIISLVTTGAAASLWQNSTAIASIADVNVGTLTLNQAAIGVLQDRAGSGLGSPFDGRIALFAIYGRALATAERLRLETYAISRWGIVA